MRADLLRAYAVLNLSPPVDHDVLKRQYRILTKQWHPDLYAADPIGQAEATQRMREINDAYRVVAASAQTEGLRSAPREPGSRLSRETIDRIVASINRSSAWRPQMTPNRWMSLSAIVIYVVVANLILSKEAADNRAVAWALGDAIAYFWLPLYLIWSSEAEDKPHQLRLLLSTIGWVLVIAPALVGAVLWAWD
jgi:DnaJ domain